MLPRYHDDPHDGDAAAAPNADFAAIPAIDLRGGRVVRLRQGDFDRETAYDDDPVAVARRWAAERPPWLHVVDLDGARTGSPQQLGVVARVVDEAGRVGTRCQVAGGLRHGRAVEDALAAGAARVILGTALLEQPTAAADLVRRFGDDRICAAIDVREGRAVGRAWTGGAEGPDAIAAIATLLSAGVTVFVVTAIARDGLLGGPDLRLLERAVHAANGAAVIASGGIASVADIRAVRELGCRGAILGRALYDGTLTLADALSAAREAPG